MPSSGADCRSPSVSRWPTSSRGGRRITACFFGDGAVAEGEFHESLNLAALWQLPVLFLCENNLYAMGTASNGIRRKPTSAARPKAYAIEADAVDGMDVLAVEAATRAQHDSSPGGDARSCLSADLPLPRAFDVRPGSVPDEGEVEQWKRRDPIALFVDCLRNRRLQELRADLLEAESCRHRLIHRREASSGNR